MNILATEKELKGILVWLSEGELILEIKTN